jgi:hypothetical protein
MSRENLEDFNRTPATTAITGFPAARAALREALSGPDLQRNIAPKVRVAGTTDRAHPPAPAAR